MRGRFAECLSPTWAAAWLACMVAASVLSGSPALAQPRGLGSVADGRASLAATLSRAGYVDSQGDRWEWQLTDMKGCTLDIRQTIRATDEPLVTDYTFDLADIKTIRFEDGWLSVLTRQPTILSRTYLRIGEPSDDRGDSIEIRFEDRRTARAAAGTIARLNMLCRMRPACGR